VNRYLYHELCKHNTDQSHGCNSHNASYIGDNFYVLIDSSRLKILYLKEIWIVPLEIDGQTYYRTSEAFAKMGISRATLFRWLKIGVIERHCGDRRGWRIFAEEDLSKIRAEVSRIKVEYVLSPAENNRNKLLPIEKQAIGEVTTVR